MILKSVKLVFMYTFFVMYDMGIEAMLLPIPSAMLCYVMLYYNNCKCNLIILHNSHSFQSHQTTVTQQITQLNKKSHSTNNKCNTS